LFSEFQAPPFHGIDEWLFRANILLFHPMYLENTCFEAWCCIFRIKNGLMNILRRFCIAKDFL